MGNFDLLRESESMAGDIVLVALSANDGTDLPGK